ncbi:MAG: threonine synthase [Bacteroidota bacterium]
MYICQETGVRYPLDEIRWRSETGGLLDIEQHLRFDPTDLKEKPHSLWRYASTFPAIIRDHPVSLGEGMTPLIAVRLGGREVSVKLDQMFPSGSYKDRGATALISLARALGVSQVVQDSSGNAGCAVAQYAAMAGIACEIFVPASTSPAKLIQIASYGATVTKVPGSREDTARAARDAAERHFYASHVWHPFFYQGTKTFAYEVCEQMGWEAPDTVILPAGNGTLLLGAAIGFRELKQSGVIDKTPKLVGVQARNCAPLFEAYHQGLQTVPALETQQTLAEGIAIALPLRGMQMIAEVKETAGTFLAVEEEEITQALRDMLKQGIFLEPTSAAVIAGVSQYIAKHAEKDETIVSVVTGHGLKSSPKIGKMLHL